MMKLFFAICIAGIFLSCKKSDDRCLETNYSAPSSEVAELASYVPNDAIQHPNGFYYRILGSGFGIKPTICSTVTVKYIGYSLPDNKIFDVATNAVSFSLGQLIIGWQKGLPLIGEGAEIELYLPPSLAYGPTGSGNIAPNAYLRFNIQLIDVQ
ncbi:MAG: FKBP-type peptidyl-prolyl cis-trans isomerase [Chitinophagaceae bacterium]|nr:FKBP-type peptidyl-prolyl cis-trans isomerase [Chitinophagaceae bacterium]